MYAQKQDGSAAPKLMWACASPASLMLIVNRVASTSRLCLPDTWRQLLRDANTFAPLLIHHPPSSSIEPKCASNSHARDRSSIWMTMAFQKQE